MPNVDAMSLAECKAALEAYDYRLDRWPDFEREAPAEHVKRAREYLPGQHDAHVAWDPIDDADGWLLVGEALEIARETCRTIQGSEPPSGPLA